MTFLLAYLNVNFNLFFVYGSWICRFFMNTFGKGSIVTRHFPVYRLCMRYSPRQLYYNVDTCIKCSSILQVAQLLYCRSATLSPNQCLCKYSGTLLLIQTVADYTVLRYVIFQCLSTFTKRHKRTWFIDWLGFNNTFNTNWRYCVSLMYFEEMCWQLQPKVKVAQRVQQHVSYEFTWIRRTCEYI